MLMQYLHWAYVDNSSVQSWLIDLNMSSESKVKQILDTTDGSKVANSLVGTAMPEA